jgi:hypothetical protein
MEQLVLVQFTPDQAKEVALLNKHYAFIKLLDSLGVFDLKKATVVLNFNDLGQIGSVDINKHYKADLTIPAQFT